MIEVPKAAIKLAKRFEGFARKLSRSQEPARVPGNRRDQARKSPDRERLGFRYWWCGSASHPTTTESRESKRCGVLRTIANSIEKPAGL